MDLCTSGGALLAVPARIRGPKGDGDRHNAHGDRQAASALQNAPYHEYQHSVFDRNLAYTDGDLGCADGAYVVPSGAGIGVEPREALFEFVVRRTP